jgi:hypothetical protein
VWCFLQHEVKPVTALAALDGAAWWLGEPEAPAAATVYAWCKVQARVVAPVVTTPVLLCGVGGVRARAFPSCLPLECAADCAHNSTRRTCNNRSVWQASVSRTLWLSRCPAMAGGTDRQGLTTAGARCYQKQQVYGRHVRSATVWSAMRRMPGQGLVQQKASMLASY